MTEKFTGGVEEGEHFFSQTLWWNRTDSYEVTAASSFKRPIQGKIDLWLHKTSIATLFVLRQTIYSQVMIFFDTVAIHTNILRIFEKILFSMLNSKYRRIPVVFKTSLWGGGWYL